MRSETNFILVATPGMWRHGIPYRFHHAIRFRLHITTPKTRFENKQDVIYGPRGAIYDSQEAIYGPYDAIETPPDTYATQDVN